MKICMDWFKLLLNFFFYREKVRDYFRDEGGCEYIIWDCCNRKWKIRGKGYRKCERERRGSS